jgi:alpha-amylase
MFGTLSIVLAYPNAKDWRSRRVYQIMTDRFASTNPGNCDNLGNYCGGNYRGLIQKLDYIKNLGFDAIWISPTQYQAENKDNLYHGYSNSDLYRANPRFGSEDDLKDFVREAHKRDIWVMADVIYNHMGNCWGDDNNFQCIKTFPKREHYHDLCQINNYNNEWEVWNCRLANLPDLN